MVEDDEDVVEFSRALLEKHNYSFEVATDGEAALVAYMTRRPDLLLLDVFVPRLDGLRFAREIQTRYPNDHIPIVVWTGAYEPDKIGDLLETPHVLPKPVGSDELLEVVRRALHADMRPKALRVLAVSGSTHAVRELVRELREDFDVHTATRWEEALASTCDRTKAWWSTSRPTSPTARACCARSRPVTRRSAGWRSSARIRRRWDASSRAPARPTPA